MDADMRSALDWLEERLTVIFEKDGIAKEGLMTDEELDKVNKDLLGDMKETKDE